jgi:hypothetical protein
MQRREPRGVLRHVILEVLQVLLIVSDDGQHAFGESGLSRGAVGGDRDQLGDRLVVAGDENFFRRAQCGRRAPSMTLGPVRS